MTPEEIAYLRFAAARDGYSADDALKVFQHESSGDPTRWGGRGGDYYGLFQAGGPERAQFGVDTIHPSARNQIDAFGRFLHARGFRPGMGLMDMYSTVLAGSPGHYGRSDGAGTVAQHVARMGGATPVASHGATTPAPAFYRGGSTPPANPAGGPSLASIFGPDNSDAEYLAIEDQFAQQQLAQMQADGQDAMPQPRRQAQAPQAAEGESPLRSPASAYGLRPEGEAGAAGFDTRGIAGAQDALSTFPQTDLNAPIENMKARAAQKAVTGPDLASIFQPQEQVIGRQMAEDPRSVSYRWGA